MRVTLNLKTGKHVQRRRYAEHAGRTDMQDTHSAQACRTRRAHACTQIDTQARRLTGKQHACMHAGTQAAVGRGTHACAHTGA